MAIITKNGSFNVSPTELSIARRTGAGSDTIYVVQGGLGGTIDGGGGIDHLVLEQTANYNFVLATDFSLLGIEKVSLGTKGTSGPLTTGTKTHGIDASGYGNGLTITGNAGANSITGTDYDDIITGGNGTDTLNGGDGSDTYIYSTIADFDAEKTAGLADTGASGTDTVSISATSGTFTLLAAANGIEAYTITSTGAVSINAAAATTGLSLTGGTGANTITGTNSADIISGGAGKDILVGNAGNDTFLYAATTDFASGETINGGADSDTISISATSGTLTLTAGVTLVEIVQLTGTGDVGVVASAVTTGLTINGNDGANAITGTNVADIINGGAGNDTITSGNGIDTLDGGEGSDTYVVSVFTDFLGDLITDTGATGTDTARITATTGTLALTAAVNGIEAYTITSTGAVGIDATLAGTPLSLTGGTGANALTGTAFADTITGGGGKDTLVGGEGNDYFDYALTGDYASGETINGGDDTDTIRFSGTTGVLTLGNTITNVEQIVLGGTSAIGVNAAAVLTNGFEITGNDAANTITGTNSADTITGGAGNDTITGGTGDDTLLGGLGNDTFIVALGSDHGAGETINGQEGTDTISFAGSAASATLTLTAFDDVENIVTAAPTGTVALNVDASAMTTTGHGVSITGNAGANVLTGSAFDDTLTGANGIDTLNGGAGNDILNGGAGNDILNGGDGDDALLYASQAEYTGDNINGGAGTDTLRYTATAAGTFTLAATTILTDVEAVALSNAAGALTGTVALGVDASLITTALTIYGNAGNNAIRGSQADDTLNGGGGNDIFLIKDGAHHGAGEVITGGAGTDEIRFDATVADSWLMLSAGIGADVERAVIGTGTAAAAVATATTALNIDASAVTGAITLVGNAGANILIGGAGNDVLDGGAGNDLLDGGEGSDTYLYTSTANYAIEESISDFGSSGTDTIQVSAASGSIILRDDTTGIEQITITGSAGGVDASAVLNALTFTGSTGANILKGTAFADVFTGGTGADNMTGNGGDDIFILNTAAEGTGDVITGGTGTDTVRFLGTGATATTNTLVVAASTNVEEIEISDAAGDNSGTAALNINASAVTASGIRFTGNAGANTITGGAGADIIEGGAGNDILTGGGGNDAILVGNGADHVTGEKIDGGVGTADAVRFTSTTADDTLTLLANTVGIERVEISDAAGDTSGTTDLNVNAAAVTVALTITGNDGANTITGTNAADTINAGGGDDVIIVSTAASHGAAEAINGGADTDTIRYTSTTAGETLTTTGLANMENIVIGTAGGDTTGTTALNVDASNSNSALAITGNDGVNTLSGSRFDDTLAGNAGNDILNGASGNDTLDGGAGNDIMNGGEGDDSFRDVNSGDQIYGGAGNDALSASTAMPDFNLTDLAIGTATTVNLVERIDLTGAGANVLLTFVAADIEAIVGAGGTLIIDANAGDELFSVEDWGTGTPEGDYTRYSNGGVDILVTSAVGFGKTFTGTTGTDTFIGSNSPDTFLFTAATLNDGDTLDGGVNTSPADRIVITGGGLVDFLASTATITGIEVIQIGDDLNTQLVLRNGAITVTTSAGFGNGDNTITLGDGTAAQDVTTGSGDDTINILGTSTESAFTLDAGAGNDTLAISGGGDINLNSFGGGSGSVTGIENVSIDDTATTFTANNATLAITAGNGGNTITLGSGTQSVASGSGADTINLGSGANVVNTGDGADTVNGALGTGDAVDLDAGNDEYTLNASSTDGTVSGGTGGSDTLTIGAAGVTTATITLGDGANTTILGVDYSNFDNLAAGASDEVLTVTAAAGGSSIETGSAGDNVTAGAGADSINTGLGNDTVNITSLTYAGDTLGGSGGTDTLAITGGNTVDMNSATISGFENISIDGTATIFIANGDDLAITTGNGDNTITLGGGSGSVSTGTGVDTINLGAGADDVNTGGGSDTVNGILGANDVVDLDAGNDGFAYQDGLLGDVRGGSGGIDTLTVGAGAVTYWFDMGAAAGAGVYSGFEVLAGGGADAGLEVTAASGGSTITTGSGQDGIESGIGTDTINAGSNDDWVYINSGTYAGDTLDGGADSDTLYISGGGTVNISTGVTVANIENIYIYDNVATTFTANDDDLAITVQDGGSGAVINLGTGTQSVTITNSSAADTVVLGSGTNIVNTGDGSDTVTGTLDSDDVVDLDAGNDSFVYQALAGDVRGGAGSDTITHSGPVSGSIDLNAAAGVGNYSGFENISAAGASGAITVIAANGGGTITTGSGNDDITARAGVDVISTNAGDDIVRITSSTYSGDTLNGGTNTGTGDTLAITEGGTVDISTGVSGFEKVTIDNSAVAANVFTANDEALAITVSGGDVGATINLGDIGTQSLTITGTGDDTVNLGSGTNVINTGDGSDTVNGILGGSDIVDLGAGADSFEYQTLSGDVRGGSGTDTITYSGAGPISINLAATAGATKYSGFENVSVTGTGDVTIIAASGGSSITTADGADILTTGVGVDNFDTGAGNDTVNITSTTYVGDTLEGGADTDTLAITGGGTVNMNLATISGFESVTINNTATTFIANNDNLAITAGNGGNTITLGSGTQDVTTGTGADTVALGSGDNIVNTGDGADSVTGTVGANDAIDLGDGSDSYAYQSLTAGGTVSGGAGNDTLIYSGSADQVIDFLTTTDNIATETPGAYSNFESLNATASVGFLNVTAAAVGGTINTGTGNDTITLGAGIDLVNTGAGADTVFGAVGAGDQISLAGADDTFAYQSLVATALVDGGTSTDTLTYAGSDALTINFTVTTDNIAAEDGVYRNFENLLAGSATGQLIVTASTGGSTIVTGAGNDTVTMGAGTDSVSTGAGIDEVIGTLSAGEAINLGADNDNYGYQATIDAANIIDADAGTGDNLTYSGSDSLTIDFSNVSDNIGAEAGFYRNFENLLAAAATGNYTVTAATTGSTINTGSGIDNITLGIGTDTVNAGGNSDTVNNVGTGDNVDLGDDEDTAVYSAVVATVSGGTGGVDSDTLQIDATTGVMTINLSLEPDLQQVTAGGTGTWTNFEHLYAGSGGVVNNLTVIANDGGSDITTGSGDDHVTLGLNANGDYVSLGDGNDTVVNIGDNDYIDLGAGDDTATYTTAVAATIDGGSHINGDTLIIASTTGAMTLELNLADTNQVTAGGVASSWRNFENLSASGATHALTVTASSLAATIITTGSGADNVTLGAAGQTITTNDGDDTVNVTGTTIASTITAGEAGETNGDTLNVTGGGTVNMNDGTVTEFEKVTLAAATTFTANTEANLSITGSTGDDSITLGVSSQSVTTAGTGDDTIIATDAMLNGAQMTLAGGGNTVVGDTLQVSDDATLDDGDFTNMSGIENLVLLGTGSQNLQVGAEAEATGIVSIDASGGSGGVDIDASDYVTTGLDITTGTGNDQIIGGDGNDIITSGSGDDWVVGEDGADTVYAGGEDDDVYGEDGNDVLYGENGEDSLYGGNHNDTLYGGAGEDYIAGEDGADALVGGADNDIYAFWSGDVQSGETLTEAAAGGTDTLFAQQSVDFSALAAADLDEIEQIVIWSGEDVTFTGAQLTGEAIAINELVFPGITNLMINVNDPTQATQDFSALTFGSFGLFGGFSDALDDGEDTVFIDASAATNSQSIIGTSIGDWINGADVAGAGDILDGGSGEDFIYGEDGNDQIYGGSGEDWIQGGDGNDVITGGADDDILLGEAGDDIYLIADAAHHGVNEIIFDSTGTADEVRFTSTTATQTLTLNAGGIEIVTVGDAAGVTTGTTALNVDASGVGNGLTITGNDGANSLTGTGFADTITGNAGNDVITGGDDADVLSGGAGADTFIVGNIAHYDAGETIDGGANAGGVDTLRLDDAGTYAFAGPSDLAGIEVVSLKEDAAGWDISFVDADYTAADANGDGTADGTITVSAAVALGAASGITVDAGTTTAAGHLTVDGTNLGGNDDITVGVGTDNIGTGAGDDTVNILSTTYAGDVLNGGEGGPEVTGDTLAITGGGVVNMTLASISNFENVSIDNFAVGNVFTANTDDLDITVSGGDEAVTINLGATGAQDVTISGTGDDTVNLGSGTNVVDTGGGSDTVTDIGAGDIVSLGDDEDTAVYSAVAATVGGGIGGVDSDTLQIDATTGVMTIDLSQEPDLQQVTVGGTGTWTNFENLAAGAVGVTHSLTVTANAAGSTIATGSGADNVTLGAGVDTVNTGDGGDTVSGAVGAGDSLELAAGNDTYTLDETSTGGTVSGGSGGIDSLVIGLAGNTAATITLGDGANTTLLGVAYSNFDSLLAGSSDESLNVTAATNGSTIATGSANDDVTAGAGTDNINTGTGDDTVRITDATYAGDTLNGGGNTGTGDTLAITGGGTVNMNSATISAFENVSIDNSTVGTNTFTANTDSLAITVSGGNENATINLGATGTQSVTITGTGNDTVALGSGINVVSTGDGADTVTGALGTGDAVDLEAGNDNYTLDAFSTDGTVSGGTGGVDTLTIGSDGVTTATILLGDIANATILGVDYSYFDNLAAGASDDVLTVTAAVGGSTIATGSAGDTVNLGAGTDIVNTGGGSDTVVGSVGGTDTVDLGAGTDSFTYQTLTTGTVSGGSDIDELIVGSGFGPLTITLGEIVNITGDYSNFDNLTAGSADDVLTVTAAAGGSVITTGTAADIITLGAGTDTVNSGDGADTVTNIGAGDTVNLQDGDDSASFLGGIAATINGGEGGETLGDTLTITATTEVMTINLGLNNQQQITVGNSGGDYRNFENLIASGATHALTVTADSVGSTITTGSAADSVTLGAGVDTVSTGDSVDVILGSLTAGDSINFGGGDEAYTYEATVATVNGGEGTETNGDALTITATTGAMTINLDLVDLQQITVGSPGTWMNFEDLAAGGATHSLNVTASSGGSTITTGSANDQIALGAGVDIVNAGDGNDGVTGGLTAGDQVTLADGDDNFTYSFLATADITLDGGADSDTLVYNLVQGFTINVDLTDTAHIMTDDVGHYVNFENFNSQTSSDVIHLISNDGAGVVTGSGADDIILSAGLDGESINTFTGADTFHGTATTISDDDTINGGAQVDTLEITGGGTINLATATVTNIEVITTDDNATDLTLNTMSVTVTMGTDNDTIVLGVTGSSTVDTGDGDDTVTLGGGQNLVTTGAGSDTILGSLTSGDTIDLGGDNDTYAYSATIDSSNEIDGGTGNDTLTYGGATDLTFDFSATADNIVVDGSTPTAADGFYKNFESLNASGASGIMTVTAAGVGSTITTGTNNDVVFLGAGSDIVSTGGGSDTVTGVVGGSDTVNLGADTDSFTYQALTTGTVSGGADIDELIVGAGAGPLTITLGEISNTVTGYSNFDNLTAGTATGILTVTAAAGGSEITTGTAADDITLGVGNDTVDAGDNNDTIRATGLTLNAGDTINGGSGAVDTLAITGGDATTMTASVTNIEFVTLANGVTFVANDTANLTITGSGDADTITTGNAVQTVHAGAGADNVTLGAASQVINGQDGDDTINVNATTIASTITAGEGVETLGDTLNVTGGGTVTMGGGVTEFENVTLAAATDFTANNTLNLVITGSGDIDTITTGNVAQTVHAGLGADIINLGAAGQTINGQGGSDTVNVTGTTIASTIDAGAGDTDVLHVTTGAAVVMGALVTNFETVNLDAGLTSFTANDTASLTINGSASADVIITGNAVQTVNAGAEDDSITLGAAGQTINGEGDEDTIHATGAQLVGATIDGGTDATGDTLDITSTSANMNDGTISNFEFVTLSASGTTFTANNDDTLTITGSGGADTITVGHEDQIVDAGAGADVIVMTDAQFDASMDVDGEGDSDTLRISDRASVADGGFSLVASMQTLELTYTGALSQSVSLNNLAETAGIVTVNASVATGNVTVTDLSATGALSITTGSGADTITLGTAASTVVSGSGDDTVSVNATTIASTITAGETGESAGDTLNVTGGATVTMGAGVTEFENVTLATATIFHANSTAGLVITGSSGADSIVLGAAGQTVYGQDGDDTINVDATTIASTIAAGEGGETLGDTLNVMGLGSAVMGAALTEFEKVTLNVGFDSFTANDTANLVIIGATDADTIITGNAVQTVNAGTGNDSITLGAAGQTINGEGNDDTVHATGAQLAGATLDGGAHASGDTLDITDTSADMTTATSIVNFEFVTLSASGTTFVANNDTDLTITGSGGADTITVGAATQVVNAGAGADVIVATYAQVSGTNADFNGDGDGDTLRITDAATGLADADFSALGSIETLQLLDATGAAQTVTLDTNAENSGLAAVNASAATAGNAVTVNASAFDNALAITTGAGDDVITLGSGINVVVTGAGSDTVNGALTASDTIDLGADNDTFDYRVTAATNVVDGGAGTGDEITYSGAGDTFNFSLTTDNMGNELGIYRNFENLDATAATGLITATAATTGSSIDTANVGAHNDVITLGAGTDTVNTYDGDDTVNATGTSLAGDTIDAGAGTVDTLAISGGGTVVMGAAVTNFEFVTLASATIFTANDTAGLTITGSGSGIDIITTGNAVQTVNAGAGNDTIIVGAAGQTINGENGNDTVVLTIAETVGAFINGGNNSDTLEFSGGGTVDLATLVNITSFENISTGVDALTLTLTNTGFLVNVQGDAPLGPDHVINSGNNSVGDDIFKFDNGGWADALVTINNFLEGTGNDVLDLGLLGIQTYWGEVATAGALVDSAFTGGGIEAVFAQDTDTLYVDLDGDGSFLAGNDLQILLTGANNLTEATDLLI